MIKIAVVGRPNVGKSTLFNRLLRKRIAIVDRVSGVTRDRLYGEADWDGRKFTVIDTGGVELDTKDFIKKMVLEQIRYSIEEADAIIFVTDVIEGLVPLDKEINRILHKSGKKIIVAANKADNEKLAGNVHSFSALGWEKIVGISAVHGLGIDNLLQVIFKEVPDRNEAPGQKTALKIAVIGRPNVGKSTFVNAVLGEARMIVDEKPGTTRDAVDVKFIRKGVQWLFIDTAGVRRKKKVKDSLEYYGVNRAFISIERASVVIFMIDGWEGLRSQDAQLIDHIVEMAKPCVIAVNKWDLVKEVSKREYRERIQSRLAEYWYMPAVFMSAIKKDNIDKLLDKVEDLARQSQKRVPTKELNRMTHSLEIVRPLKVYYGAQVKTEPPSFIFFANIIPGKMHSNYIKNQIHKAFGFEIPIQLQFRSKKQKKSR